MKKTKEEKAITLIALIITIVVLLILAAVAISSIQNDGILSYAENVANKYNQAQKDEQDVLDSYLEYFNGGVPSDLSKYILGKDGKGRDLTEIINMQTYVFIDDEETMPNASKEITIINRGWNEDVTRSIGYFKYEDIVYKVGIKGNTTNIGDATTYTTETLTKIYEREGREGQVIEGGTYDGWIILTDRNGLVEIVSPDVAKDAEGNVLTLTLGSGDTVATVDLTGEGTVDEKDTAILSYNNAITTINNYCKEVMDMENVRSVGGTNNSATPYSSTNYDAWSPVTVDVASGDMQYELDFVKLSYFGKIATTNEYWLASRYVDEYSSNVHFGVGLVSEGSLNSAVLWYVASDGAVSSNGGPSLGVRPVVINPSGI